MIDAQHAAKEAAISLVRHCAAITAAASIDTEARLGGIVYKHLRDLVAVRKKAAHLIPAIDLCVPRPAGDRAKLGAFSASNWHRLALAYADAFLRDVDVACAIVRMPKGAKQKGRQKAEADLLVNREPDRLTYDESEFLEAWPKMRPLLIDDAEINIDTDDLVAAIEAEFIASIDLVKALAEKSKGPSEPAEIWCGPKTAKQWAAAFKKSPSTFNRYRRNGDIRCRKQGSNFWIHPDDVATFTPH